MKLFFLTLSIFLVTNLTFSQSSEVEVRGGNIRYFNLDTLNSNLYIFTVFEAKIIKLEEEATLKMEHKQNQINLWQESWEKKGELLTYEQHKYQEEAVKIQDDAMLFEQKVREDLQLEQERVMVVYAEILRKYTKEYAEDNNLDAIHAYSFGQPIWYYKEDLDITQELAKLINSKYKN